MNSSNNRTNERGRAPEGMRGRRDESEFRPARATGAERPTGGRGRRVEPEHVPGTVGHTMRREPNQDFIDVEAGDVRAGAERGTSRAVRVTNPKNKRKKVA